MENVLKNAYAEVEQILDFLGDSYKNQIPPKLIRLFNEKKNINHNIYIDANTKVEDIKLSRTTIIILSILNLKYWETNTNKKMKLKTIYDQNEDEYQEKINIYKQDDWLKDRNKNKQIQEVTKESSLIEIKKYSIFDKIKNFFKKILNYKK